MPRKKYNKLEKPLEDMSELSGQLAWADYEYADKFAYLCEFRGDRKNEKLIIEKQVKEKMKTSCVYILVIDKKIFKIGAALRGMAGRIGSYNSGRTRYKIHGSNSGTNYWCLQSFINLNKTVKVYAFFPEVQQCSVLGESLYEPFPSAKTIEGVIIRQFQKKYNMKPLGCTQS